MSDGEVRRCHGCAARLAWDNDDVFCSPCRKSSRSAVGPPDVPSEFWHGARLSAALREWHMGHVLRAYRTHPFHGSKPLSQDLLAGWLNLTQAQVSRIESGPPVTDLTKLVTWASTLRIPENHLWFRLNKLEHTSGACAVAGHAPGDSSASSFRGTLASVPVRRAEEDLTRRRQAIGALGLGFAEMASGVHPAGRIGADDVRVIRDMLSALTATERQFGGGHAREYAADYLGRVIRPRLHARGTDGELRELFAVAAEFALRVASMQFDAGHTEKSRSLLASASAFAQEADDTTLTAWTLARRGEQEIDELDLARPGEVHRRRLDRALAYTSAAAAMARTSPPTAKAFILTKYALALSLTGGGKPEAQRVLGQVWDSYGRAGTTAEPPWMRSYGWAHLRHEEGRCLSNLGMGVRAVQAAAESLPVRTSARPKAFSLGVMAMGHVQAGEIDRACASARDLIAIGGGLESARVRERLREVLRALEPYCEVAEVRDVFEATRTPRA